MDYSREIAYNRKYRELLIIAKLISEFDIAYHLDILMEIA
jgi:hypothetical protein